MNDEKIFETVHPFSTQIQFASFVVDSLNFPNGPPRFEP